MYVYLDSNADPATLIETCNLGENEWATNISDTGLLIFSSSISSTVATYYWKLVFSNGQKNSSSTVAKYGKSIYKILLQQI